MFNAFGRLHRITKSQLSRLLQFVRLSKYTPSSYSNPTLLSHTLTQFTKDRSDRKATYFYVRQLAKHGKYSDVLSITSEMKLDRDKPEDYKIIWVADYASNKLWPPIANKNEERRWGRMLVRLGWFALLATFMWPYIQASFGNSGGGGGGSKRQSKSDLIISEFTGDGQSIEMEKNVKTRFSDVLGIDEYKEELTELVDYLKNLEKYEKLGAKLPKGILLVGPPGTGKTLLARALAGEAGCSFFYKSGSEFDQVFVGLGAKRIRKLFQKARQNAPSIIFIDQIDSLAGRRNPMSTGFIRGALNQFLAQMDGFKQSDNIVIIGATNFQQSLDPAVKRPGRFDKTIQVPLPDVRGRQQIVQHYLKKIKHDSSINKLKLARRTVGFSGADLENMVNVAILNAVRQGRKQADQNDFEFAFDRIKMGVGRKNMFVSEEDKKMTAYHQIGHALTALLTEGATPVHKVTILPRGGALGFTATVPQKDDLHLTKKSIMASIDVAMGGRAAQQVFFGNDLISTGCSSDLKAATRYAYYFVGKLGMKQDVSLASPSEQMVVSEEYKTLIDTEVNKILKDSYNRVKDLIKHNRKEIELLVKELVEHETLSIEQIKRLLRIV